jgi:nitronate monooxygenase
VVANAATRRWCHDDGRTKLVPRLINAGSGMLAKLPDRAITPVLGMQRPGLPLFSPIAPTIGMPDSVVDPTALYAGETVLRMTSVISAQQAVTELTPR